MLSVAEITAYSLAGYVGLALFLYMLSPVVRPAGFLARSLAAYWCLLASALLGLVTAPLLRAAGVAGLSQWFVGRCFAFLMAATTGIRFDVRDPAGVLAATRPAVLIGNHQTELDVLMLGTVFPPHTSVTAKASLRSWPVLGWWMASSGTIFIDRRSSRDAREAMRGAAAEITSRRQSVYIFPEGTRSYARDPILLPFKKGAFHLAVEAGVPIVPCVVANYSHVLSIKALIFRSGTIPVKVMDPISTTGLTAADVDDLTRRTRDAMLRELLILSAEAKGQPVPDLPESGSGSPSLGAAGTSTGVEVAPESPL